MRLSPRRPSSSLGPTRPALDPVEMHCVLRRSRQRAVRFAPRKLQTTRRRTRFLAALLNWRCRNENAAQNGRESAGISNRSTVFQKLSAPFQNMAAAAGGCPYRALLECGALRSKLGALCASAEADVQCNRERTSRRFERAALRVSAARIALGRPRLRRASCVWEGSAASE